ncbi:MAG: Holliday junction branch migration protein RuvA [Bacteroidaceae bacterium]|nr:Holliday junction branch migration protein RuvA [Bacteroidaceae bacterium]
MIEYIKGEVTEITPATVTLETSGGVAYLLNVSLNTYTAVQGKKQVRLYVHEAIREDAWVLFGFATKEERELFLQLITVSGIGGNTARMILSALSPRELCDVIATGNDKLLKTVKGIGLKTAQRIIVDLKDKIKLLPSAAGMAGGDGELPLAGAGATSAVMDEAVSALTMLGFPVAASQKVVMAILKEEPSAPVERVIKVALKRL